MVQLITESEAAELLRLTPRQVLRFAKRGELPSVILPGNEVRFDPVEADRGGSNLASSPNPARRSPTISAHLSHAPKPLLLTARESAKLLSISERTLYDLTAPARPYPRGKGR